MNSVDDDTRILVIGFGNPLRGDDGVGWVAAQRLANHVDLRHVGTMAVHQLMPELAETISLADRVIFIDAAADSLPGYFSSHIVEPEGRTDLVTHQLRPAELLQLCRQLYGHCPSASLLTIGGEDFGHHEGLSSIVERACELLVKHVAAMLKGELTHA